MVTKSGELTPRPYARLLTMLSEQLIKNNIVALTELAKNSYDADANWVQIRIGNMKNYGKKKLGKKNKPFIEIEDDGDGMSFNIIKDAWMNPASPHKYKKRKTKEIKTRKGRIIQGEKGIGRFAVFQIGQKVEIFTRERLGKNNGGKEINLITDLSNYTDELTSQKTLSDFEGPLYFDQLISKYYIRDKSTFIKPGKIKIEGESESRKNHGTLIRITDLNYKWTSSDVKKIRNILSRIQSPFRKKDFAVSMIYEGKEISTFEDFELEDVLDEALLEMIGSVDENGFCKYNLRGKKGTKEEKGKLDLVKYLEQDAIPSNRTHFLDDKSNRIKPECGPFDFKFYVYNLEVMPFRDPLKGYIKSHRTYVYRDDIRVYPYGDHDNDWIKLDIYRGLAKAGFYLSNDQLIGYVSISLEGNPGLRDKTNREGLLEQGRAYEDLRYLTLSALNFLHVEYQIIKMKPKKKPKRRKERVSKLYLQSEKVEKRIKKLDNHLEEVRDQQGKKFLQVLKEDYYEEKEIYEGQVEIVEDLAGVGIAVDATSHDIMIAMNRSLENIKEIRKIVYSSEPDLDELKDNIVELEKLLIFNNDLLVGVQPLFRSSRRKGKELRISEIVNKVIRYYKIPLEKINVKVDKVVEEVGPPLVVTSSEGVLLQLFINLMDNSIYWLNVSKKKTPQIKVYIDGEEEYVIFADNGPGVQKKYIDYIFEPFFSTKGIQGRGLGLYIARQLTDKYEYDLYYLDEKREQILHGANFRIDFIEKEE